MTTPREYADMAQLYFFDSEMDCWRWNEFYEEWQLDCDPSFNPEFIYHVGKEKPTEPPQIMCELAGVKFPMPEQEQLNYGKKYFLPLVCDPYNPYEYVWDNTCVDKRYLQGGLIQLTKEGAIQQVKAMREALKQSIEKAKERTK